MTKKIIHVQHADIRWSIDGLPLKEVVEKFAAWAVEFGPDATLDISAFDDYGSATAEVVIEGSRVETDDEYATRLRKESARKVEQDARDAAEFKRLQAKFSPQGAVDPAGQFGGA